MEYWSRWVWGDPSACLELLHSYRRVHVLEASLCLLWRQSRTPGSLTLVSVTTTHRSLPWTCNRHLSMVELPNATVQTGKTAPGNILHLRQGLLLDHSGMEGVSSRIILCHLDYGSRDHDLSLVSGICMVAINISMVLLPCAASSTWTWVNQLLTLVQSLGRDRTTTYQHFKTLSHLGHL